MDSGATSELTIPLEIAAELACGLGKEGYMKFLGRGGLTSTLYFRNDHTMQKNCKKLLWLHMVAVLVTAALEKEGWKDPEFEVNLGRVATPRSLRAV